MSAYQREIAKMNWTPIEINLSALSPWEHNPKTISKSHAKRLLKLWDELGQFQTIAVGPNGEVYDGHQRLSVLLAAHGAAYTVKALQSERALTEEERAELVIAAHVGTVGQFDWQKLSGWDTATLTQWGMDAETLQGWNSDAANLAMMLQAEAPPDADAEPQIDRAAELNEKWQVKTGDLWRIGEHRLLCGDSTKREDVERVIDVPLEIMVTDPPYGVDYESEKGTVTNDDISDWTDSYKMFTGDVAYIWHGERTSLDVGLNLRNCGFQIRARIIWVKPSLTMGRGDYHFQHEGAWYGVRNGKKAHWCGDHSQSSVWNIGREDHDHPTVKPVDCMMRPIRNHEGDVYDPFVGSGTTLVACQNLQRKCRAIEISPNYCAVILERMATAFPGIEIERVSEAVLTL